jgi:hypothetical protein
MGRLRRLGYPVDARPGVAGGYRLGTDGALPPLLLDDKEAVAAAVGLRTAASGSIAGIEETSVRALAKLQQVLPARLRDRIGALVKYWKPHFSGASTTPSSDVANPATSLRIVCAGHLRCAGPGGMRAELRGAAAATWRIAGVAYTGSNPVPATPPSDVRERGRRGAGWVIASHPFGQPRACGRPRSSDVVGAALVTVGASGRQGWCRPGLRGAGRCDANTAAWPRRGPRRPTWPARRATGPPRRRRPCPAPGRAP